MDLFVLIWLIDCVWWFICITSRIVEFKSANDAHRAIETLNREQLDGRQVFVKMDQNDSRNNEYFDDD